MPGASGVAPGGVVVVSMWTCSATTASGAARAEVTAFGWAALEQLCVARRTEGAQRRVTLALGLRGIEFRLALGHPLLGFG